ncbi:MAG: hypothetical protein RLZZ618_2072 [Pseudomonadota bacterium]|jgi:Mlc titration factor MtfA (ptsG expression regulator)
MPGMSLLILFGLVLAFAVGMFGHPWWVERRRERIRRQVFPKAWRTILRRRVPHVSRLPADLQLQLKQHIQVFIAEKAFIGCRGLVVTDEMRVTVAAQACLLLLSRKPTYFPTLRQVLLYPGAFMVDRIQTDHAGLTETQRQVLLGESWVQGQVILSWQSALEGAAVADDGHNVVIHEFAHQLDQEKGHANGAPPISGRANRERWKQVMSEAFQTLQRQIDHGEPTALDPYGATNPAEFFAVASEVFFERPAALAEAHPAVFAELSRFYGVNPLSW